MTPAERARQIDREEFAAECAAVRQRASAFVNQRRFEERARIAIWLGREAHAPKFVPVFVPKPKPAKLVAPKESKPHPTAHLFTHDGKTLTLKQWAEATGISALSLRSRIANGWSIHDALTVPLKQMGRRMHRPGVVSNLPDNSGTGAGSVPQATGPVNNFSESEACPQ